MCVCVCACAREGLGERESNGDGVLILRFHSHVRQLSLGHNRCVGDVLKKVPDMMNTRGLVAAKATAVLP